MTIETKQKIYKLVKVMCGTYSEVHDAPTDDTWSLAGELLKIFGVSSTAIIEEIPLCWNKSVAIRFTLGDWEENANECIFNLCTYVSTKDPSEFIVELYAENDYDQFPVPGDNDFGIRLFKDTWIIKNDRIVE